MTLATALRGQAEDLVDRALGGAPATQEARDRLVEGALRDPRVRMGLRLAEYAHDTGDEAGRWRELWRALDTTRRSA